MIGDARYDARAWMLTHVSPDDIVAVTEFPELVPRLDGFRTIGVATVPELAREQPRFVVLNADYARSATPGSPWADLVSSLEHESAGYRLAASFRHPSPWPWLPAAHPDLVGRSPEHRRAERAARHQSDDGNFRAGRIGEVRCLSASSRTAGR